MNNLFKSLLSICSVSLLILSAACNNSGETSAADVKETKDSAVTEKGFVDMFDGKTLNGWDGDTAYWRVENGELVGEVTEAKPLKNNTFLIWKGGEPGDFEFKAEFKINPSGNSGCSIPQRRTERYTVCIERIPGGY
ncbi:MAG: DUF1080 domain-containing protein [Bacteroidota bacterium]